MAVDQQLKIEMGKQGVFVTTLQELYNWGRRSSVWPMQFGLACCGTTWRALAQRSSGRRRGRRI
jgi:NADH:ubiquinone oxidoreductase subunit B-like Fe-S oxidoreductase